MTKCVVVFFGYNDIWKCLKGSPGAQVRSSLFKHYHVTCCMCSWRSHLNTLSLKVSTSKQEGCNEVYVTTALEL